jgi:hypothetical protein
VKATVAALDAAFVFAVCAGAMIFPPLGLAVGAVWLAVLVVVADRREPSDAS